MNDSILPWFEDRLARLVAGPNHLKTLGWVILDGNLRTLLKEKKITEAEYTKLHNRGLKELNFEI